MLQYQHTIVYALYYWYPLLSPLISRDDVNFFFFSFSILFFFLLGTHFCFFGLAELNKIHKAMIPYIFCNQWTRCELDLNNSLY